MEGAPASRNDRRNYTDEMSDTGLVDHCLELLAPLGATRARRMFGGHGLYIDDMCVAIIAYDTLYLKTDDENRAEFDAAKLAPFEFVKGGETIVTSSCSLPGLWLASTRRAPRMRRRGIQAVACR